MRLLLLAAALAGCSDHRLVYEKTVTDTAVDTAAPADTDTDADSDADTDADTDTDTDTDTDADTDTDTAPAVCERILVYSTEETDEPGNAIGRFDDLPGDAALGRWEVTVWERAIDGAIDAALVADYSQVWLLGTDPDWGTGLDFDEVRALRDFVEAGNGLLVAGGPEAEAFTYADDVNGISEPYGVEFGDERVEGVADALLPVEDPDGALLAGVSQLPAAGIAATLERTNAAVAFAASLGGEPAVAYRDDGRRIVFDRSWVGWTDRARGLGDQATFVGNVAAFLEPCDP